MGSRTKQGLVAFSVVALIALGAAWWMAPRSAAIEVVIPPINSAHR